MASNHRYTSWTALALAALSLLFWPSHAGSVVHPARNVIIVTLDTTRADVLAAYGGDKVETPALDRLSREGIVFEQATSPVPLTLPAHASLFTGLLPPHHGVRDNVASPLGDAHTTLAELLRQNGARTAAFVGSAVVDGRRGLAQGFDTYSDGQRGDRNPRLRRPANIVVDEATTWIARQPQSPFFAWVHLYDAHAPYLLPEPYRTMYEDAPYLGAIAFMDAQLQRLLTLLDDRRLTDDTLVIVAADHGESLGDHGEDGHGIFLYQSTVHIPLLVRAPRLSPRRVPDTVRLVDLMPTVLDLLRIGPRATDGVSLAPLMTGDRAHVELDAYSESFYPSRFGWANLRALRAGRFKFVSAPRPELYDLEKDPTETRNLYGERVDLAVLMSAALDRIAKPSAGDAIEPPPSTSDVIQRIASLGYVSPARSLRAGAANGPLDDPKDCIGVYNAIVRAGSAAAERPPAPVTFVSAFARQPFDDHVSCSSRPSSVQAFSSMSASASAPPEGHTLPGASR